MIHALIGAHTAHRQRLTTSLDHSIGSGIGEKMRRAPLGFAAADLALMGFIHGAMVGQSNQINRHSASTFPQVLGNQPGQEVIDIPLL
jgi:hypothetical protein